MIAMNEPNPPHSRSRHPQSLFEKGLISYSMLLWDGAFRVALRIDCLADFISSV
jgi:hypothetical protein